MRRLVPSHVPSRFFFFLRSGRPEAACCIRGALESYRVVAVVGVVEGKFRRIGRRGRFVGSYVPMALVCEVGNPLFER